MVSQVTPNRDDSDWSSCKIISLWAVSAFVKTLNGKSDEVALATAIAPDAANPQFADGALVVTLAMQFDENINLLPADAPVTFVAPTLYEPRFVPGGELMPFRSSFTAEFVDGTSMLNRFMFWLLPSI